MKTRFANAEDTEARDIARAETQRADIMAQKYNAVRARIDRFFNAIDYVVFADEETAPRWAERWRDYLLDGAVPVEEIGVEMEIVGDDDDPAATTPL